MPPSDGKTRRFAEGQRAAELFPVAKDAVIAPSVLGRLAEIYARVGEPDRAFELLEKLIPGPEHGLSTASLSWSRPGIRCAAILASNSCSRSSRLTTPSDTRRA